MSNPFSGIITQELKNLHTNMIKALLEDSALTVPCRLYYGITKYNSCTNCSLTPSSIGRKASNTYIHGGPVPFGASQSCPVCGGEGKIPYEYTENLNLAVIFDPNKFLPMDIKVKAADNSLAQTLCVISSLPKLLSANYIIFDTNIEGYNRYKYEKMSNGQPMGFGSDEFVLMVWKRI